MLVRFASCASRASLLDVEWMAWPMLAARLANSDWLALVGPARAWKDGEAAAEAEEDGGNPPAPVPLPLPSVAVVAPPC